MGYKSAAKEAYWREKLDQHKRSGQSIREFCRQRRLSEASFYFWRKQVQQRRASKAGKTASRGVARTKGAQHSIGSTFIPLQLSGPSNGAMELVHPRGHVLRIPAGFHRESLQQVLELLDSKRES